MHGRWSTQASTYRAQRPREQLLAGQHAAARDCVDDLPAWGPHG